MSDLTFLNQNVMYATRCKNWYGSLQTLGRVPPYGIMNHGASCKHAKIDEVRQEYVVLEMSARLNLDPQIWKRRNNLVERKKSG